MKKRTIPILLALMMLWGAPFSFAQQEGSQQEAQYAVRAVLPENQISNNTYFDLRMQPEQVQELRLNVFNESDEAMTIRVQAISSSTSAAGVIDNRTPGVRDQSLRHPFSEIAQVLTPTLEIPAGQGGTAVVRITMPADQYDGVIQGSIFFTKEPGEGDRVEQEGIGITNVYSTAIGVLLSETDVPVAPDFEYFEVRPELFNSLPAIVHYIRNSQAAIARDVEMEIAVFREGQTTPLLENAATITMAPNSAMPYATSLPSNRLEPGRYRSQVTLKMGEQVWELERSFEVTPQQVQEIEANSAIPIESGLPVWAILLIILAVVVALLLIALIIILAKRRKQDEEDDL